MSIWPVAFPKHVTLVTEELKVSCGGSDKMILSEVWQSLISSMKKLLVPAGSRNVPVFEYVGVPPVAETSTVAVPPKHRIGLRMLKLAVSGKGSVIVKF